VIYHAAVRRSALVYPVLAALASQAHANPAEVFGLGSRAAARVGAVSADSDDFAAGYYNPAGPAFAPEKRIAVGFVGAAASLQINDIDQPLSEPYGGFFGVTLPAPVGGALEDKLVISFALFAPAVIARVIAHLPDEPFFPYYDNRTQRLVVLPGLAWRATPSFAVGIGLNILATLGGGVLAVEGPTRSLEPRVDEEIATRVGLHAGVRWEPGGGHRLALVFRQAFGVRFSTKAAVEVAGEPIDLDLSAEGLYTPHQLVLGYAWAQERGLVLSADVTLALWSAYDGPYVKVASALPLVGALPGRTPDVPFENTAAIRVGVEKQLGDFALRAGYGWESSPVPGDQHGITNLIDGHKHLLGVGGGVRLGRLRIDLHAQLHLVGERVLDKRIATPDDDEELGAYDLLRDEVVDDASEPETLGVQISNPGFPEIRGGGKVLSGGITMEWLL
jgi:hypothetical protein